MTDAREMHISVKRVYEPAEASDGLRVFVDRLWPRGLKKCDFTFDEWAKCLAPSTEARRKFGHKAENFASFAARYRMELDASEAAHDFVAGLQSRGVTHVTLLYAARDPQVNHAVVLRDWMIEHALA